MYHTNCEDAQTDRSLVCSQFSQVSFLDNKINHKTLLCEARDASNAKADLSSPFARTISVISLGTCTCTTQLQTSMFDRTACVTKVTL